MTNAKVAAPAGSLVIESQTDAHGVTHTYAHVAGVGRFMGKLSHWSYGPTYVVLNLRTGRNTHDGVRFVKGGSDGENLAQMLDDLTAAALDFATGRVEDLEADQATHGLTDAARAELGEMRAVVEALA